MFSHSESMIIQGLERDIVRLLKEQEELKRHIDAIVDAWDWWQVDTYDRCESVVSEAIDEARQFLPAQSSTEK